MEHETAGDPVSGLKWTRKTTAKIAQQLKRISIQEEQWGQGLISDYRLTTVLQI